MSEIGYYRYKTILASPNDTKEVNLYINNNLAATKTLVAQSFCNEGIIIKYLNKDGQWRFFGFNKYYQVQNLPEKIGDFDNLVLGLRETKSYKSNVGFRNKKQYNVTNESVTREQLEIFSEISTSLKVLMYIGDYSNYEETKFIEVSFSYDNLIHPRKNNSVVISGMITIEGQNTISRA